MEIINKKMLFTCHDLISVAFSVVHWHYIRLDLL